MNWLHGILRSRKLQQADEAYLESEPEPGPDTAPEPEPLVPRPGQVWSDRYQLLEPLGKGSTGEVWRARDLELDMDLALKLMKPRMGEVMETALRHEARAAMRLDHASICRVYHFEYFHGVPGLVMELLDGEDLHVRRASRSDGRLPLSEVLFAGLSAADALRHAHSRGVTHNDLKPANLFRTSSGAIKLMDFGLGVLSETQVFGTPSYMDPTQLTSRGDRQSADLYGLAATLYTVGSGRRPFGRGEGALKRAMTEPVPRAPELPQPLFELLAASMVPVVADRPSLDEFFDLLAAIARTTGVDVETADVSSLVQSVAPLPEEDPSSEPTAITPRPRPVREARPRPVRSARPGRRAGRAVVRPTLATIPSSVVDMDGVEVEVPGFRLGVEPVTNKDFAAYLEATGARKPDGWSRSTPKDKPSHPVTGVTWDDAQKYAAWVGGRLPTTAEWLAALRTSEQRFPWGSACDPSLCHCPLSKGPRGTVSVETHADVATPQGVRGLLGNVWEWTSPGPGPRPANTEAHWVAGGSYRHACGMKSKADPLTAILPHHAYRYVGFRVAADASEAS